MVSAARGLAVGLLVALIGGAAIACSSPAGSVARSSAGASSASVARHTLVVTSAENGATLAVRVGDQLRLVLIGAGWGDPKTADAAIVKASGKPSPLTGATDCAAGESCGSTTYFDVLQAGTVDIVAARTSCGTQTPACATGATAFRFTAVASR
jgi:hypothetical protein